MKKNSIVNILSLLLLVITLVACRQGQQEHGHQHGHDSAGHHYTADTALAPLLQPVNEQVISRIGSIRPGQSDRPIRREIQGVAVYDTRSETNISSRVTGRIEKLYIKYNYQPVKKGQVIMQVYSPDLVAAQRELLFISEGNDNPALLQAAKQRLQLLGMTGQQLEQLLHTRQPVYSVAVHSNANGYIIDKAAKASVTPAVTATPAGGESMGSMGTPSAAPAAAPAPTTLNTPVLLREGQYVNAGENLFTVYKADKLVGEFALPPVMASEIRKGQPLRLQSFTDTSRVIPGIVGLIQPVFRNGENFTLLRVYLNDQPFKAGTLLKASIPVKAPEGWWLPEAAVLQLGNRAVVFKKEGRVYKPVTIQTGMKANGQVQVPDSIAHWDVASNAYYLVDSESFINE